MKMSNATKSRITTTFQVFLIVAVMATLTALLGFQLFGRSAFLFAGLLGGVVVLLTPRASVKGILSSSGIRKIHPSDAPWLHQLMARLAARAGLKSVPQLGYLPSPMMNALSVGTRSESAIVVTHGLLASLSQRELAGVLAHEVSHIRNHDLTTLTLSHSVRRMTAIMAQVGGVLLLINIPLMLFSASSLPFSFVLLLIGAPIITLLLHLALSRRLEFNADMGAVDLTQDPASFISALRKISAGGQSLLQLLFPMHRRERSPLLRTHPDTVERIRRIERVAKRSSPGHSRILASYR